MKLGPLTGGKVRLRVELAIANPRPQRLTLAGIDADLSISGSPFGKASAGALRLEPKEKRRVSLLVVASRATVSKTIRAMAGKAARFEVTGVLRLADGKQRIPFAATAGKEIFGKPNWSAITGQSAP